MRVLFFVPRDCRPPNTGGKLRNFHLSREVARDASVTYLSFSDGQRSESLQNSENSVRFVTLPKSGGYSPVKLARGLLGKTPFTVLNYTTPEMQEQLTRLLQEESFDIVQVEHLTLMHYLPILQAARPRPLLVLDWHNVDSEVMERYADHAPDPARRVYARATARRIAALERDAMTQFDAHLTVSDRDREHLLSLNSTVPVWTIENGADTLGFAAEEGASTPKNRIVFVGSMDYHANIDAAQFFAREVWPDLHRARPNWIFTLVGRDPAPAVRALGEIGGIEVTGTVPDVKPFYREALASVVPLRVGGGSRLKILEAMAARVPVVSTLLGAEGLEVRDGETILIRDEPDQLGKALLELESDNQLQGRIVDAAHDLAVKRYDWTAVGAKLRGIHQQLLMGRDSPDGGQK
jgi:glycosyltransferase involved in cell wall biosynthesis